MINFTKEQLNAINYEGKNIIVSAGAGSGKTAVLSERVLRKLKDGIDINKLLVLTFTNEAALEMKNRIRKKIAKEKSLEEQLNYLDSSYITTFDSYSLSIVKKYHYLLNISDKIDIVDSNIITILKKNIIDELFEQYYLEKNNKFLKLINDFCMKDDLSIKESIINISKYLDLKEDKEVFLANYLNNYFRDEYINNLIKEYENLIRKKIDEIDENLTIFSNYCTSSYYENMYNKISPLLESKDYDSYKENCNIDTIKITKEVDPEGKLYKDKIFDLIKEVKSFLCYDSKEFIKNIIIETKEYVEIIIEIINKLDNKINVFKKEHNTYEYIDISKMAIKVVKDNKEVQEELKNYFNEILVDEYQDTNDLQEIFINLIANNNVYMVGDVKQSIYRFRNANPKIFKDKYDNYSNNNGGIKIDLLKNFRSRKEVLENINLIFDYVMDNDFGGASYKLSHEMEYGNESYSNEGNTDTNYNLSILNYVKDQKYQKEEIEAFIIANDIKNKIKNKYPVFVDGKLRPITYNDICIIMDRGTSFDTYKQIFSYNNIPLVIYADEKLTNEYDILVIKNILGFILKINNKEFDKEFRYLFTSIARSFIGNISDNDIFNILNNNEIFNSDIFKISSNISNNINHLSNLEVLNEIITDFDIYYKLQLIGNVDSSNVRIENLQNIASNLEKLGFTPDDFYNYLKNICDSKEEITYKLNNKVSDNVKIMNIHKSKGLEFNICYFPGLHKEFNISDLKERFMFNNNYGIITPYYKEGIGELITKKLAKHSYIKEEISERIRLFYVALTRAKEQMIVVTSFDDDSCLSLDNKIKYKSFLDILKSIKPFISSYITTVNLDDYNLSKDYKIIKKSNYKNVIKEVHDKYIVKENNIEKIVEQELHASKIINKLITKDDKDNMEYGTYMHYLFEVTDFYNPKTDNQQVLDFINSINLSNVNIYKEHEFIYLKDNNKYHGIIDLILEYPNEVKIIDYKLKHTTDDAYLKQLSIYKDYLSTKYNKEINTYLYSIMDKKLFEIK